MGYRHEIVKFLSGRLEVQMMMIIHDPRCNGEKTQSKNISRPAPWWNYRSQNNCQNVEYGLTCYPGAQEAASDHLAFARRGPRPSPLYARFCIPIHVSLSTKPHKKLHCFNGGRNVLPPARETCMPINLLHRISTSTTTHCSRKSTSACVFFGINTSCDVSHAPQPHFAATRTSRWS